MKRKLMLLCLPLLAAPLAGHVLIPYWEGEGIIPESFDVFDFVAILVLPFVISGVFAWLEPRPWWRRLVVCLVTFVVQVVLLFTLSRGSAESEVRGLAARYRREFQPDELRFAASNIWRDYHTGALKLGGQSTNGVWFSESNLVVNDRELPKDLRNRFQETLIETNANSWDGVIFATAGDRGILYSTNEIADHFWHWKIDTNLYAYRYQRP